MNMVYGEPVKFPLIIYVKSRMIGYWYNKVYDINVNELSTII